MRDSVVQQMLARYDLVTAEGEVAAFREIMQEIALAGLYRSGFFEKAAFYGGTCLRIFYGLDRFSEDLDFSLLLPDPDFNFEPFFEAICREFEALGIAIDISVKRKSVQSRIESAFLKKTSSIYDIHVKGHRIVKIKLEVDTDPPQKFSTEEKLLVQPFSFYVKSFVLSDLFAGKLHALLFRKWKNRIKGRDWYDFEWYIRRGCAVNINHLCERANQSGDYLAEKLDRNKLLELLSERIESLDIALAKSDVQRFVRDTAVLDIWSVNYFMNLAQQIRVVE